MSNICISIVSHDHGSMVCGLIKSLLNFNEVGQIILTLNTKENLSLPNTNKILIISNEIAIGFGENHNNAYKLCTQPFFCVLNPDIKFNQNPFPILLSSLNNANIALSAPTIISNMNIIEDSARKFPTLLDIINKFLFSYDGRWPLELNQPLNYPDWVAGMFMLFSSPVYKKLGGFDERYFLYYEDVDICRRIRSKGYQIALCTHVKVIHNAQRTSRKNIKFMFWHLKSLFRFLFLKTK